MWWIILVIAVVLFLGTTRLRTANRRAVAAGTPVPPRRRAITGAVWLSSLLVGLLALVMVVSSGLGSDSSDSRQASSTGPAASGTGGASAPSGSSKPAKQKPIVLTGTNGAVAPGQRRRSRAPVVSPQTQLDPPGSSRGACAPKNIFLGGDGNVRLADVLRNKANNGWTRRFLHGDGGLLANRNWFDFRGHSLTDVRHWLRGLKAIKLHQYVSVLDTYCSRTGVMKWHAITLSPGEWVMVKLVKKADGSVEARIVAREGCANLLLPLRVPKPRPHGGHPHGPGPSSPGPHGGGNGGPKGGSPGPSGGSPGKPGPGTPTNKPGKCKDQGTYCGTPQSGPDFQNPQDPPQSVKDKSQPTPNYEPGNAEKVTQQQQPGSGGDPSGNSSTPKGTDTGSPSGGSPGQTGGDNGDYSGGSSTVSNPPTDPPNQGSTSGDPCPNGPDDCG